MACLLTEAGESVDLLALVDQSAPHTLRWRGRVSARTVEVLGTGPEERRSRLFAAAARRAVRSRYDEAGPAEQLPGAVGPDWLRALRDREREHHPSTYHGPVVVFTTRDTARYTGSASLGWDRYVGEKGDVICLDRFGASAPGDVALRELGFNVDNIRKRAKSLLRAKDRESNE